MNTGLKWIKDTNSYNAHTDKLVDMVGSTNSTVSASRLKSVGRNKINSGSFIDGKIYSSSVGSTPNDTFNVQTSAIYPLIEIKEGETYNWGNLIDDNSILYDKNKVRVGRLLQYTNPAILSSNIKYAGISIEKQEKNNAYFIQGKEYEPYKESTAYVIAKDKDNKIVNLRSLPNGTKDEIRVGGGRDEHIKRNNKKVLQASDIIALRTDLINLDVISISRTSFVDWSLYGVSAGERASGTTLIFGFTDTLATDADIADNIGKNIIKYTVGNILSLGVAKGTYANLAAAQTALTGLELTYQLAEPIITPIQVSGNLISYPSGTVYVENVVADAGMYTTKFDIKELQLPIKSIDKLIKYNFTTGVQTVLDTSLAVINEDKKSFIHPNLAKDDMVFVDYYYDVESTLGETTIEYLDSRHTIKDTTNNKFYKWDIKSENGVPTVNLTEVL